MSYFAKKKKKKCCHLTRRWGRRTSKRSHLLPQIIPPACRALEFQISGPQVRRPWKWGRVGFTVSVREQGRVWPFWAGSAGSAPSWATGPGPRSRKVFCNARSPKTMCTSAKRSRHAAHGSKKHAGLPQPANAVITAVFIKSYKARERPPVILSPACFLLKQKTINADCMPFTLDGVKILLAVTPKLPMLCLLNWI